jgi:tRNA (guanine26-N2/guanine27-N2)-dimethyltransferase
MKEIIEGGIRLLVPETAPSQKKAPVFFNPRMKLNRDICCAVVRGLLGEERIEFLDLLAGTGAKGLRVAKEAGCRVALNDANPKALEAILKTAELNELRVDVYNKKANLLLQEIEGFNFIDIDPFGTPVPFLDNAVMALKKGGYLGVTATDTAPLCGVHPKACLRKYGAVGLRTEFCHEVGMRILIGYIARTCAKYAMGASCLISHYNEHYFRTYIRVSKGKKEADKALDEMGYLYYCKGCLNREYIKEDLPRERKCRCGARFEVSGPLWLGRLGDRGFLKRVFEEAWYAVGNPGLKTIRLLLEEIEEPFYYDLHKLCKSWKIEVPPMDKVLQVLRNLGFEASRTHYSPTGIKTNATVESFKKILLK